MNHRYVFFNEFKKQGFLMNLSLGDCNMIENDESIDLPEASCGHYKVFL